MHYTNLGISNLYLTIQVPVTKRYIIQGFDIIDIIKHDNYNFLTIDLMQNKSIDETF